MSGSLQQLAGKHAEGFQSKAWKLGDLGLVLLILIVIKKGE